VSNSGSCGGSGSQPGAQGSACSADELIARVHRLLDMPRPVGGYPLEWLVEASHVGDLTAIATVTLLSERPELPPPRSPSSGAGSAGSVE
jgi:hypothetical protein